MRRHALTCLAILATMQACAPQQPQRLTYRYIPPAPPLSGYSSPVYTPPPAHTAYVPPTSFAPSPAPTYEPEQRSGFTPGQALLATAVLLGGICWMTDCLSAASAEEPLPRRGGGGGGGDGPLSRMQDTGRSSSGDGGSLFDTILPFGGNSGLYGDNPGTGVFRPRED